MRVAKPVIISDDERVELQAMAASKSDSTQIRLRANIILAASEGLENNAISNKLRCCRRTVGLWRNRFVAGGIAALSLDAPRTGRKPAKRNGVEAEVLRRFQEESPPEGTRWTIRLMAKEVGVSKDTIHRIWTNNGIRSGQKATMPQLTTCAVIPPISTSSCCDSRSVSEHLPVETASL